MLRQLHDRLTTWLGRSEGVWAADSASEPAQDAPQHPTRQEFGSPPLFEATVRAADALAGDLQFVLRDRLAAQLRGWSQQSAAEALSELNRAFTDMRLTGGGDIRIELRAAEGRLRVTLSDSSDHLVAAPAPETFGRDKWYRSGVERAGDAGRVVWFELVPGSEPVVAPARDDLSSADTESADTSRGGIDLREPWNPLVESAAVQLDAGRRVVAEALASHLRELAPDHTVWQVMALLRELGRSSGDLYDVAYLYPELVVNLRGAPLSARHLAVVQQFAARLREARASGVDTAQAQTSDALRRLVRSVAGLPGSPEVAVLADDGSVVAVGDLGSRTRLEIHLSAGEENGISPEKGMQLTVRQHHENWLALSNGSREPQLLSLLCVGADVQQVVDAATRVFEAQMLKAVETGGDLPLPVVHTWSVGDSAQSQFDHRLAEQAVVAAHNRTVAAVELHTWLAEIDEDADGNSDLDLAGLLRPGAELFPGSERAKLAERYGRARDTMAALIARDQLGANATAAALAEETRRWSVVLTDPLFVGQTLDGPASDPDRLLLDSEWASAHNELLRYHGVVALLAEIDRNDTQIRLLAEVNRGVRAARDRFDDGRDTADELDRLAEQTVELADLAEKLDDAEGESGELDDTERDLVRAHGLDPDSPTQLVGALARLAQGLDQARVEQIFYGGPERDEQVRVLEELLTIAEREAERTTRVHLLRNVFDSRLADLARQARRRPPVEPGIELGVELIQLRAEAERLAAREWQQPSWKPGMEWFDLGPQGLPPWHNRRAALAAQLAGWLEADEDSLSPQHLTLTSSRLVAQLQQRGYSAKDVQLVRQLRILDLFIAHVEVTEAASARTARIGTLANRLVEARDQVLIAKRKFTDARAHLVRAYRGDAEYLSWGSATLVQDLRARLDVAVESNQGVRWRQLLLRQMITAVEDHGRMREQFHRTADDARQLEELAAQRMAAMGAGDTATAAGFDRRIDAELEQATAAPSNWSTAGYNRHLPPRTESGRFPPWRRSPIRGRDRRQETAPTRGSGRSTS